MIEIDKIAYDKEKGTILELIEKYKIQETSRDHVRFKVDKIGHIKSIDLNSLNIKKIPEALKEFTHLKSLNLSYNLIQKIQGLELPKLQKLSLASNKIKKLENLDNLPRLNRLYIYLNEITKIEGLENLKSLEELNINSNQLTKIEGLDCLTNLKRINLCGNQIKKIEGLEKLQTLRKLYLHDNLIKKIEGLDDLQQLEEIHLNDNEITGLEGLDKLSSLREVWLLGNPLTERDDTVYRRSIEAIKEFCKQKKLERHIERLEFLKAQILRPGLELEDLTRIQDEIEEIQKKIDIIRQ